MSGLKLSPKYGLNPTIPVCFWCGNEKNEVVLMGHVGNPKKHEDIEAPKHAILDFEPCEECVKNMAKGFTVIEATTEPNNTTNTELQKGVYPTGNWVVIKNEAAQRIFPDADLSTNKMFVMENDFKAMFGEIEK